MWRKWLVFGLLAWLWPISVNAAHSLLEYGHGESFDDFVARSKVYLKQHKVWVNEQQQARELSAVLPFELKPDSRQCEGQPKIGLLLSHGLSDSPFSMRDPALALQQACYQVRVILLPGHGTQSADLLETPRQAWRDSFRHAAEVFEQEVDVMYVGGFSTGGALALEYAWTHPDKISGVVLFSPLLKVNSAIDWLSPLLATVKDWLDNYPSDDFAKYASIPLPAIAEAYKLAKEVRNKVMKKPRDIPVFIAMSEQDQTVDSKVTLEVFNKAMISSKSQMVMYSIDKVSGTSDRLKIYNSRWPEQRILGMSHMAVHGNPQNPYYGSEGEYRICGWYFDDPEVYEQCRSDKANWFGEKSDELSGKSAHAARLSWNPDFASLMKEVSFFMQANAN
ncbi:alpha/beta fold hydrolase [Marinomonas sp. THO17]|uniref:alpha/beta hydrolase n=1 Tax=Marinomonas sp. THO17 TaxID=3149048 RepID=UPI00336C2EDB